ncbi:alpha/beta hydrolase [Asticcacaulis sp. 201]|uniref:alpha/beta hydrolase n=1 Tax=Asticcacaulis sp. 201 TaxID=3028787 RepID=UPI002915CB3D|nr:alpha/beta fold hydrolase [Asticcacaulis sp. 201]MDV6330711.1 alpha/beta fold hydrolase [Asticcacaulis sp. 201]
MNMVSLQAARPVVPGRELVILVHGLTGAPDEMRFVAKKLRDRGYDVATPLLAGHGQGYPELIATGWRNWLASLTALYDDRAPHYQRVHVAGICVGGLLGFMLAQCRNLASCTVYAPLFAFDGWAMKRHYGLLPLALPLMYLPGLRSHIVPEAHPFGLKDERLRALVAASQESLIEGALDGMPYKCLADTYLLGQAVLKAAPANRTPLTLVHALEDDICSVGNAERLMKRAGGDARLVILEDSYHMVHVDRERSKVVAATLEAIGYREEVARHA